MKGIKDVISEDRGLIVKFKNGKRIEFESFWLRDYCRCPECFNQETLQRVHHLLDIPDVPIENFEFDKNEVKVIWSDKHESIYQADFLSQFDYQTWNDIRKCNRTMWCGDEVAHKITRVSVDSFLKTNAGAESVFRSILKYGVAFIDQVDATLEATEEVCEALGGVQRTILGRMWNISVLEDHAETAFSNLSLSVHNDSTYFTESTGLQILHCIEHSNGTGGNSILVDGFYGATRLKEDFPDDFQFLTEFNLEAEYSVDGQHLRHAAPVIKLDRNKDLEQIRYNMYDRSAMSYSSRHECRAYYRSLKNLCQYYENPKNQWHFKLKPGLLMVIDNFRLLHGRTGFTGKRVLCGSYVARTDWLIKARALQLIH